MFLYVSLKKLFQKMITEDYNDCNQMFLYSKLRLQYFTFCGRNHTSAPQTMQSFSVQIKLISIKICSQDA